MSESVTLRLDLDVRKRLDKLAKATDRAVVALAAEEGQQYVELNEWQITAIQDGLRDADHGRFIDHARLKSRWEKRLALALDKVR